MVKYDNCKSCQSGCEHAGKDREFVCIKGISCKVAKKTNADRIRGMSDEELAKLLMDANDCKLRIPFCQERQECLDMMPDIPEDNCLACMVAWLQKPAEVE